MFTNRIVCQSHQRINYSISDSTLLNSLAHSRSNKHAFLGLYSCPSSRSLSCLHRCHPQSNRTCCALNHFVRV